MSWALSTPWPGGLLGCPTGHGRVDGGERPHLSAGARVEAARRQEFQLLGDTVDPPAARVGAALQLAHEGSVAR